MTLRTADIAPIALPKAFSGLDRLARNLYWAWHPEAQSVFQRIDPVLWSQGVGPVRLLQESKNLNEVAKDRKIVAAARKAIRKFDAYLEETATWFNQQGGDKDRTIAYFCAEFGLHESFALYSGGLGILAGDHAKEASDMGLPFVGVGLFYRRGFFKQMIDRDGRQEHFYGTFAPESSPALAVLDPKTGSQLKVSVELPGRMVHAAVWAIPVGRINILMLDTDLPENATEDRPITSQLYTSGRDMRLHQEIVLGVGGARALAALGITPSTWHMNEGHSAFLLLERLRDLTAAGTSLKDAQAKVKAESILTIHTPVPAGNERFHVDHATKALAGLLDGSKLKIDEILALGRDSEDDKVQFDLTGFALRHSRMANGVSLLHGETADGTWRKVHGREVIGVTNGVHMPTWLGAEMKSLFTKKGASFDPVTVLEVEPREDATAKAHRAEWNKIDKVTDGDLWQAHMRQKRALVEFARRRLFLQHARHGEGPDELREWLNSLDENALIIGFARRFATYKRASLLFSNERRLLKLLNDPKRPVRIVFAGKAHPADRDGQALIQKVYEQTQRPEFKGKVFLLEEYDMEVGRMLVGGVDVWLNNPRRPLEASGTSGMKAAANGVPNVSILDGWWDEGFDDRQGRANGFAIGGRESSADDKEQDRADAQALYRILEKEVLPKFFRRDRRGVPRQWVKIMRRSIASSVYAFSTFRMLEDYMAEMIGLKKTP